MLIWHSTSYISFSPVAEINSYDLELLFVDLSFLPFYRLTNPLSKQAVYFCENSACSKSSPVNALVGFLCYVRTRWKTNTMLRIFSWKNYIYNREGPSLLPCPEVPHSKPSPALPTDHVFIPCFFIQIPHKVPILSETISLLLREGRKHKIGQKAELDLLNLALLEWELLRKAQTYFYIVYSYKYYVVQNEHSVSKLASSCIINQILNLNLGVITDLGQIQKRKKDTHM